MAMSNAERVKRFRKNNKLKMILAMGSACQVCGYDKCPEALTFHHLDPNEKDFGFGWFRSNPQAWETVVEELRKCVLLCQNCHMEFHAGLIEIPSTAKRFDESFA